MVVRTIPNLQVDKIMIRKKRNKSSQKVADGYNRKGAQDENEQAPPHTNVGLRDSAFTGQSGREIKVKWKIVKQKLQSPKSVLARENLIMKKRKKSVDELIAYPRH